MLVLSRKPGERIVIGENVVVELIAIQGNRARLGVSAPSEVPITRAELLSASPDFQREWTGADQFAARQTHLELAR